MITKKTIYPSLKTLLKDLTAPCIYSFQNFLKVIILIGESFVRKNFANFTNLSKEASLHGRVYQRKCLR